MAMLPSALLLTPCILAAALLAAAEAIRDGMSTTAGGWGEEAARSCDKAAVRVASG